MIENSEMTVDPREFGRLEAKVDAMKEWHESARAEAKAEHVAIRADLHTLMDTHQQQKGAMRLMGAISGVIGGAISALGIKLGWH